MKGMKYLTIGLVAGLAATTAQLSSAQTLVTSGDACDVRNPAAKNIRRKAGEFQNVHPSSSFNISCPLMIVRGASTFGVGITMYNYNPYTERARCVLTEYDWLGFSIRSRTVSRDLPAYGGDEFYFANSSLVDYWNRLHMDCSLPSGTAINEVFVDLAYFCYMKMTWN